jgi:hypothetical protein
LSNGADHRPYKWALALGIDPRVKVIGDHREAESALLCSLCLSDQVRWPVFFARQLVSNLEHANLSAGLPEND